MNKILLLVSLFFICAKQQLPAQTVAAYLAKSDSCWDAGDFQHSLHFARLAEPLIIDTFGKNSVQYGHLTGEYFSMNHENLSHIDSGLYWYKYSIDLLESLYDTASNEYGDILTNYGNMLNYQASYYEAFPYLFKAVEVMKKHQYNVDSYLGSMNNLANCYNYCGEYANAEVAYLQCLQGMEQHVTQIGADRIATLLHNLATIYQKTGNIADAEIYFIKAGNAFKQIPEKRYNYFEARKNLGSLYFSTERTDKAETIFNELYNDTFLITRTGDNPNDAFSQMNIQVINGYGNVKEAQKNYTEAEKLYKKSFSIANKLSPNNAARYSPMSCLAKLYSHTYQYKLADSLYTKMIAEFEKYKNLDHYHFVEYYAGYCKNLIKMHKMPEAFKNVQALVTMLEEDLYKNFPGMTEESQMSYTSGLYKYLSLIFSTITNKNHGSTVDVRYALNHFLQLKGIILNYQTRKLKSLRTTTDSTLKNLQLKYNTSKQILYNHACEKSLRSVNVDSLEKTIQDYERNLSLVTGIKIEKVNDTLADEIAGRLGKNEAALEYVRYQNILTGEDMYGLFVIRPGQPPMFKELCTEKLLRKYLMLDTSFNTLYQIYNYSLVYKTLWGPVEALLKNSSVIYYSPDGLLNYFSMDALKGTDNQYLLDTKKFVLLSGTRNLINHSTGSKLTAAVLWGNIDCSEQAYTSTAQMMNTNNDFAVTKGISSDIKGGLKNGFKPLNDKELPILVKLVQQKKLDLDVYQKDSATEDNFKKNALAFKGILHISSHGFYASQPDAGADVISANAFTNNVNPLLRCGLILNGANYVWSGKAPYANKEDGILTGYEIALMDLSKLDLVVLSACETGLGDIATGSEGVLGLKRAFTFAGVNKMILALWNVNPDLTKELMTLFYTHLLNNTPPSAALRMAKKQMAKKTPPYAWAGFVLVE